MCFRTQLAQNLGVELVLWYTVVTHTHLIPMTPNEKFDNSVLNEKSLPILKAAYYGHVDCVKLLIPVTEKTWIHSALSVAVERNNIECVKLLMRACDPKERNSLPLQLAAEHNNEECIALLYDVSDPVQALKTLLSRTSNRNHWSVLKQRLDDERLRDVLSNEVKKSTNVRKHKI